MLFSQKVNEELERQVQYIDSDSLKLRNRDNTEEFIKVMFDSALKNFEQKENSLRGSNFVFSGIDLTFVQFVKFKLKRGGSYIQTREWISVKKAIINPKNTKDECCFAYSIVASIHNEEIDNHPERISKLTPYNNNYDWTDINFPSEQKDWNKFEKNNKDVSLNVLSARHSKKKINIIRVSKFNRNGKHQVILLMITDENKKWHYVAVKCLSRLCRTLSSNNNGDFYCLNCLHAYRAENSLKKHEQLCLDNKYCHVKLPKKGENILYYKADNKSIKTPHIIYADLECLLRNIENCNANPNKSYQTKNNAHIPSGYSIQLVRCYDENSITHYCGIDCMKKFVKALKIIVMMIGKTKKAKTKRLTSTREYEFNRSNKS